MCPDNCGECDECEVCEHCVENFLREVDANNEWICVEEEKCFENCAECTAGVCSICNRGYFFNLESTECVSDCGKGYYGDTAGYCV